MAYFNFVDVIKAKKKLLFKQRNPEPDNIKQKNIHPAWMGIDLRCQIIGKNSEVSIRPNRSQSIEQKKKQSRAFEKDRRTKTN